MEKALHRPAHPMTFLLPLLQVLAGVGIFLFAMHLLESSLRHLSGRNFKRFLQRVSRTRVGGVVGATIVTTLLQSSSMVSMMVLAFVGAGVFGTTSALAIILGANLGTTLASWVVATVGFKVDLEVIAYPAAGIGGLLLMLMPQRRKAKHMAYFIFGFGLLFIGLSFMKDAMEQQVVGMDLQCFDDMPPAGFLLIGFLTTVIVQSSSVTMALTLSALYAGAISFPDSAALVLGGETGTTLKLLLGAVGGNAVKKRVALGNVLFNLILTVIAFLFLQPVLLLITQVLGIRDPLIGLVSFSTLINLFAILIFLPLLDSFSRFLDSRYREGIVGASAFLKNANSEEPQSAYDLFQRETGYFLHNILLSNLTLMGIDTTREHYQSIYRLYTDRRRFLSRSQEEQYNYLKELQGELQAFYLKMRPETEAELTARFGQLIASVRSAMHAAKSMTDIASNIQDLRQSSKDIKFNFFLRQKIATEALSLRLHALLEQNDHGCFETLRTLLLQVQEQFSSALNDFYREARHANLSDLDITSLLNFNRELFTANKAMLMAVKDFLLDEKEAEAIRELPVYAS